MTIGKSLHLRLALAGLFVAAATTALPATATTFGVRVIDESGEPVSGASVCIGLEGNHKQFGAMFTGDDGIASTEVPNVPVLVTISKTRFSGLRVQEPARGFNLIKDMTLIEGVPGPRCRAESALADASGSPIQIRDIDVFTGDFSTRLRAAASGAPTHYRVAADREFSGASWQRYSSTIPLSQQLADAGEVYLQLRRYSASANASLESRSAIISITLTR